MTTARNIFLGFFFLSLAVIAVGAMFWANLLFAQRNPGGVEFRVVWSGARAYTINAISPYSEIVASQVQRQVYGRPAREGEPVFRVDVPLHYLLLLTPFALIDDFPQARAWWMVLSQVGLVGLTLAGLSLTQWRAPLLLQVVVTLFGLFWAHAALAWQDGSLVIVTALLFAGVLLALRAEADEVAGILLAFATLKAEAGILFLFYILIWSGSRQRWGVPGGFAMALIVLAGVNWIFQPNWAWEFARAVFANLQSGPLVGVGVLLEARLPGVGARASQLLTGLVTAILLVEWNASRNGEFRHMLWTSMLTLTLTPLSGLPTEPSNHVLLFLPLLLALSVMDERWGRAGRWMVALTLLVAFVGLWSPLVAGAAARALILPLPLALTILLYWVRWWAVRPPRTWIDQVTTMSGRFF